MKRIKTDPTRELERARKEFEASRKERALAICERFSEHPDAKRLAAVIALSVGDFAGSLRWLEGLDDAASEVARAEAHLRSEAFEPALAALERAILVEPNHPTAYERMAAVHRAAGEIDAALHAVDGALALAPDRLGAMVLRAALLEDGARHDEALEQYRAAVRAPRGRPSARRNALIELAELLERREDDAEAAEEAVQARALAGAIRTGR